MGDAKMTHDYVPSDGLQVPRGENSLDTQSGNNGPPEPTAHKQGALTQQGVVAVERYALKRGIEGATITEIVQELVNYGVGQDDAFYAVMKMRERVSLVEDQLSANRRIRRNNSSGKAVLGAIICIVGLVISIGTYNSAGPGESYVVAWGAVVFGFSNCSPCR